MSTKEKKQETNKFWERLGIPVCSLREARDVEELCFKVKQTPCLIAEAGTGKTQLQRQIAQANGWEIVFMYLAHLEREDIGGIPYPVGNGHKSYEFLCESSMARIIDSGKPTLLVFDEWNRGEKSVMNAAFTVMESRRWGSRELPDNVFISAAMNPSEASYLVNEAEKDPAFRRRLVFIAIQSNVSGFLEHARGLGNFHPLVVGYITAQPQALNDPASRDAGKVYANPAAWEKISDGLYAMEKAGEDFAAIERKMNVWGCGLIGIGTMSQFLSYVKENASVVNPFDILDDYNQKARSRVQRIVGLGRNDAFNEISESLAIAVVSSREEEKVKNRLGDVAKNIGDYLFDLPREGVMAFLSKLGKHATDAGSSGVDFQLELSDELSQHESYQKALEKVVDAHEKVEEEKAREKKKPAHP